MTQIAKSRTRLIPAMSLIDKKWRAEHGDLDYITEYLRRLLNSGDIEPPDRSRCNGHGELVQDLYDTRCKWGVEAAAESWKTTKHNFPELDAKMRGRRRRLFTAEEMINMPQPTFLIPDILPANSLAVLYGPPGCGKTFVMLDFALQIAQTSLVVYVAAEGKRGFRKRLQAWRQLNKKDPELVYFLPEAVDFTDRSAIDELLIDLHALEGPPVLVVVDTLARCMGSGDENSATDMGIVISHCSLIQESLNTSVLLVHHTGKDGKTERGSTALRGAADTMISISKAKKTITVACAKAKDASEFLTYRLKLTEVKLEDGGKSCAVEPTEMDDLKSKLDEKSRSILEVLNAADQDTGTSYGDLQKQSGVKGGTFKRKLDDMKLKKYVNKFEDGLYFITDEGRKALGA